MEYQSFGRYQKPKGSNMNLVLKMILVLVFSVWLLCQIKHAETKNYGGQTKVVVGCEVKLLGRKGIAMRSDERDFPDSGNVDSVGEAKESSSGMDRVSDRAKEEKDDEEFEHIGEEIDEVQSFRDENGVPPDSNEDTDIKEKGNEMQKNVVTSAANAGVIMEEIDDIQSFHDENGVPPDSNEENISTFSRVNWLKKIDVYDATNGEDNDIGMNLEGSINATTNDEEINMGTTTYIDTSGLQSRNRWR